MCGYVRSSAVLHDPPLFRGSVVVTKGGSWVSNAGNRGPWFPCHRYCHVGGSRQVSAIDHGVEVAIPEEENIGHYPATYSFEGEAGLTRANIEFVRAVAPNLMTCEVVDIKDGHKDVLHLKSKYSGYDGMYSAFFKEPQTSNCQIEYLLFRCRTSL